MSPLEYDGRRPRIPKELAERIDGARGQVPFERWVREALEAALVESAPRPQEAVSRALGQQAAPPASPRAPEPESKPYELPKIAKRKV